jgi:pyruvate,water dikinase
MKAGGSNDSDGCSVVIALGEIAAETAPLAGGKAANLGRLLRAGLPVPEGFCVLPTQTEAGSHPRDWTGSALRAYGHLGCGSVAVRSSASGEDSAQDSFAGQQETMLNVQGEEALLAAIERCMQSVHSERARAYRQSRGIHSTPTIAAVVQRMVHAEVAGVLFTRDPTQPDSPAILVEASWGLGDAIVSGQVTPDRYAIHRETGALVSQHISDKAVMSGSEGLIPVPEHKRRVPCLSGEQLHGLLDLARQVEDVYGAPQDVEWAWAQGQFWLLQARPITTAAWSGRERARQAEIRRLAERADPRGTVWSQYSLSEVLPEPLPMTWSIIRRFMSGSGGYGLMYRDLGYDPDPALNEDGIVDLICGRTYINLSRECLLYFRHYPYRYPFLELKLNPAKALYPRPSVDLSAAGPGFWRRLPSTILKLLAADRRLRSLRQTFHVELQERIAPAFMAEAEAAARESLAGLAPNELLERLEYWVDRSLNRFARESLKPSVLAAMALESLERGLSRSLPTERARSVARCLVAQASLDHEVDTSWLLSQAAVGKVSFEELIGAIGHRGSLEMELAEPRWREQPDVVRAMLQSIAASGEQNSTPHAQPNGASPSLEQVASELARAIAPATLSRGRLLALATELQWARLYVALREAGKHWLMAGYAEARRCLLELDSRYGLDGGVFFLEVNELPRLVAGEDLRGLIQERRRQREVLLSIECPRVIFSDDLDAIGRPEASAASQVMQGTPVSAGLAVGPALVARQPDEVPPDANGFVLVCPSTDPGWTAVFARAKGLVMETGGVLSHGAIVAREFRIAAVAAIPGVLDAVPPGATLRVDGDLGVVSVLAASGRHPGDGQAQSQEARVERQTW